METEENAGEQGEQSDSKSEGLRRTEIGRRGIVV